MTDAIGGIGKADLSIQSTKDANINLNTPQGVSLQDQARGTLENKTLTTGDVYKKIQSDVLSDDFWADNPNIIFQKNRLIEFFPTKDMSTPEKLNALTRFFIYLSIILFIVYKQWNVFYIPIIAMIIFYIIYKNDQQVQEINVEKFNTEIKDALQINPNTPITINDVGDVCQKPTHNNPFMNVLISDITANPNRPPACYSEDPDTKEEIETFFNYNLYKDVDDVWDKRNSQREYVTQPSTTIPNDRDTFMKWCWNTPYVCKDGDEDFCMSITYDDGLKRPGYT